jgi:hypothetical protein
VSGPKRQHKNTGLFLFSTLQKRLGAGDDHSPPRLQNESCKEARGEGLRFKNGEQKMSREIDTMNKKRRMSMSRKTKNRTSKPRERPINSVVIEPNDEEVVVGAFHEKGVREQYLLVGVVGGISTEAAIRLLRLTISYLEKRGLPAEPMEDLIPVSRLKSGYSIKHAEDAA